MAVFLRQTDPAGTGLQPAPATLDFDDRKGADTGEPDASVTNRGALSYTEVSDVDMPPEGSGLACVWVVNQGAVGSVDLVACMLVRCLLSVRETRISSDLAIRKPPGRPNSVDGTFTA